jgi:hypothetical protein
MADLMFFSRSAIIHVASEIFVFSEISSESRSVVAPQVLLPKNLVLGRPRNEMASASPGPEVPMSISTAIFLSPTAGRNIHF